MKGVIRMQDFYSPKSISRYDLKRLRSKLEIKQGELATLVNVSKKTIERWESSDQEINGPITTLFQLFNNNPDLLKQFKIPQQMYKLRLRYMFRNQLCTIIDVDEKNRRVKIYNFQTELIYRAFGKVEEPTYEQYEEFIESRCIPRNRDKIKLVLRELDLPFYDPMLIIEKTQGKMVDDEFWIEVENEHDRAI
jgi:DNA-binding XRE family transcriptional regulator